MGTKAVARLHDFDVQEVSLVPLAANKRRFVITKGMGTEMKVILKALSLPGAVKDAMTDGIAQALDQLTAIASAVGEASAEDGAPVPPELGQALSGVASMLDGLAKQYAGGVQPAAGGAAPPAAEAGAAKALPAPLRDDNFNVELHEGENLKAVMRKIALALQTAEKAGRKISGARFGKLSELYTDLGTVLAELASDEGEATPVEGELTKTLAALGERMKGIEARLPPPTAAPLTSNGRQPDGAAPATDVWAPIANDIGAHVAAQQNRA